MLSYIIATSFIFKHFYKKKTLKPKKAKSENKKHEVFPLKMESI